MSSNRGFGNSSSAVTSDPSLKSKGTSDVRNPSINQPSHGVSDVSSAQQDDGWEEYTKKSKNRNKMNASKQWSPQQSTPKAWGQSDTVQKLGLRAGGVGYGRGSGQTGPVQSSVNVERGKKKPQTTLSDYVGGSPVVTPPLKNGWGWSTRAAASQSSDDGVSQAAKQADNGATTVGAVDDDEGEDDDEESDGFEDSDDDLLSDDCDETETNHETRKNNKWFKELFQCLDELTVQQINEPERQWHCPACKGGPGAIDWYSGMQPLISHARTKRSKRAKLHRELVLVLEEELRRRGTSSVPAGEKFGKWQGLKERADKQIVWPPMVVIMNTQLEKDENDKWKGMGNQELLEFFSDYNAEKARHSYGPQGHRGISVLIFEASAVGYAEAERLSKSFEDSSRDRLAWDRKNKVLFKPGGNRQLYGFMAEKQDLDYFNQHSQAKSKLKFEMCSYQEMVVKQMKQMSEDNQQLIWLRNKVAKEKMSKMALEQSLGELSEKLRKTLVDNRAVKKMTKKHYEQNKEEMDSQEQFYNDQIEQLYAARGAKEEKFEETQLIEREKVTKSEAAVSSLEERSKRSEEIAKFIQDQDKDMAEFIRRKDVLIAAHAKEIEERKRRRWEEDMALEKQFDEELNKLMDEYTPSTSKQSG